MKPWKSMRNQKSMLLSERSQFEKATYCTKHWKMQNCETISNQQRWWEREGGTSRAERILRALKILSVGYSNDMLLFTCPNPQNVQHEGGTLRLTTGFEWLWYVDRGLSLVTNILLRWEMLIMGEALHRWGQGLYEKSLHLLLNIAVNLKLI